jgi:uncharacterized membrane protein YbhN (UPF0104 family)
MNLRGLLRPLPHLERHPWQHAILIAIGAALAVGALFGVAWTAGFHEVLELGARFDGVWLPVAFGFEIAAYLGYIVAYRELVRVEGGPSLGMGRAGAMVAAGFGVFVIRGGFVVDRLALEMAGIEPRLARIRVLGLGALEYAVLAPAAAVAAMVVVARGQTHPSLGFTLPWVIAVPLGIAAAVLALAYRDRVQGRSGWRNIVCHGLDALHVLRRLAEQPRRHGGAFLGTALYWLGDIACLWAALKIYNAEPSTPQLVLAYATGYVLTRRSLPAGGAGPVEVLMTFALVWVGIPLAPALLGVVTYRLFNFWLPVIPALAALPAVRRMRQDFRRGERAFDKR